MAQPVQTLGLRAGPGSRSIATTLLEMLAVRARSVDRDRAIRALALGEGGLASAPAWLSEDAIGRMFEAARVEKTLGRTIGHRLVEPDATGLLLYGLGLATPEKAYRRIQALLPREARTARWSIDEIRDGTASLSFRSSEATTRQGLGSEALCAMRTGMLEGIPGLYGLLPARVQETECQARGASRCVYRIVWQREVRDGLVGGLALGAGMGAGLLTASLWLAPVALSIPTSLVGAAVALALAASIGRCRDLTRQLQAVAGSRRGQLALLDQADDLLASKIDAIARVEAKLDESGPLDRGGRTEGSGRGASEPNAVGDPEWGGVREEAVYERALEIFAMTGALGRELEAVRSGAERGEMEGSEAVSIDADRLARLAAIRDRAFSIIRDCAPAQDAARPVALDDLVAQVVAAARPSLDPDVVIEIEAEAELPPVRCEPTRIEQVVVALLRNAVEASVGLSEHPRVAVELRAMPGVVEVSIEDRGRGLDSTCVDEVFDPFFSESPQGARNGSGLPECLRIVERHGGEMRIEGGDRAGTRVSIALPVDPEGETQ